MYRLSEKELVNIYGGSISSIFEKFYMCYRIIKIRILMEKVFID